MIIDRRDLFGRIAQALGAAAMILAAVYFWFPAMMIGRGVFMIAATLVASLIVIWRVAFEWVSAQIGPRERLLLVGTQRQRAHDCAPADAVRRCRLVVARLRMGRRRRAAAWTA